MAESPAQLTSALVRTPYTILEALAANCIRCDPAESDDSAAVFRRLRKELEQCRNSTDALQVTGRIVRTIESRQRAVNCYIEQQAKDVAAVVAMLLGKIEKLAAANGNSATNLRRVGRRLETAGLAANARLLKEEVSASLRSIQEEAAQQEEQAAAIRSESREIAGTLGLPDVAPVDRDPATGLPSRSVAEIALARAVESQTHVYVLLLSAKLGSITRRFGDARANQVLLSFADQLTEKLGLDVPVFHWKGPTVMILLERPDCANLVPDEMSWIAAYQPKFTLEVEGVQTVIQLSTSSISLRLWEYHTLDAIRVALEQFQTAIASGG